jgi:hypothetical protein
MSSFACALRYREQRPLGTPVTPVNLRGWPEILPLHPDYVTPVLEARRYESEFKADAYTGNQCVAA